MELQKIYKYLSNPLEEVKVEDMEFNKLYILSSGTLIKSIGNNSYIIFKESFLNENENVESLSVPKGVELLWKIAKKSINDTN